MAKVPIGRIFSKSGYVVVKKGSKYKYVLKCTHTNKADIFRMHVMIAKSKKAKRSRNTSAYYTTEREAAIAVDKYLISIGREPVNILKRKMA